MMNAERSRSVNDEQDCNLFSLTFCTSKPNKEFDENSFNISFFLDICLQRVSNMAVTFSPQTAQDWYKQIEKDLKGKPLEEILVKNYENIPIKAFFMREDVNETFSEQLNSLLKAKIASPVLSSEMETKSDLISQAIEYGKEIDEEKLKSFFEELPTIDRFFIHISFLHNAGANAVQELAFALAVANFYLDRAKEKGKIEDLLPKMSFLIATGSNFFMEIAKLRVLPYLINRLVSLYLPEKQDYLPFIKVQTAKINKSKQDAYNNVIRATLEAMAATIAQADDIQVFPHDYFSDSPDSFSENIAHNIKRILHYESKIDFVKAIPEGAYFVEYLGYQLAQRAWQMFGRIENEGGIVNFWEKGLLKKEILEIAKQKIQDFKDKKTIQIGVNKYPNPNEELSVDKLTSEYLSEGKAIRTFRMEEFL